MFAGEKIKSYTEFLFLCAFYFLLPCFAFAASVKQIFARGTSIVLQIIQVLWLVAAAVFLLGVLRFIASANNPEKRKSAKNFLIYGLVGFFVLLSFWGLIRILQSTFLGGEYTSYSNKLGTDTWDVPRGSSSFPENYSQEDWLNDPLNNPQPSEDEEPEFLGY